MVKIMPPGEHPCNRKIGAMNSVIRGCVLLMALTGWTEPAFARSYLNCLTKKVVIVDTASGSISSHPFVRRSTRDRTAIASRAEYRAGSGEQKRVSVIV